MTIEPVQTILDLTEDEARALTGRIRDTAETMWALLVEAHDRKAWTALNYRSFKDYVDAELDMSRAYAYRLLDQGRVIAALAGAAEVSPFGDTFGITEGAARELKPHLALVEEAVREATENTEPEARPEAARAAIDQVRQHIREEKANGRRLVEEEGPGELADEDIADLYEPAPADNDEIIEAEIVEDEPVPEPERPPIVKPDLGDGISHPARFSKALIPIFAQVLHEHSDGTAVLDPFAGVGGVHALRERGYTTVGIELEPEWANLHEHNQVGDATDLPFDDATFDAIVTSPAYGNRLADSYNSSDPHLRRSYHFDLGRELTEGNAGAMHWGDEYRELHLAAWAEAWRVLRPGGVIVVNSKDHFRSGILQLVPQWHAWALGAQGFKYLDSLSVATPNLRQGTNAELRAVEEVFVARKPAA